MRLGIFAGLDPVPGPAARAVDAPEASGGRQFAISPRGAGGLAGAVTLCRQRVPGWCVAYFLRPRFRGRGLAGDAVAQVLRLGFGDMGLDAVWAEVLRHNLASIRLLERLGFRFVGLAPHPDPGHSLARFRLDRAGFAAPETAPQAMLSPLCTHLAAALTNPSRLARQPG